MKNDKGFTLIELLASITIMAIILLLVIPSVSKLKNDNQYKTFDYYADTLVAAAKVYVAREDEDLTDLGTTYFLGCVDISYQDLLNSDLIKPYTDSRYDCSDAVVRYTKGKGKTTYQYNLVCIDTKENKEVYEHHVFQAGGCEVAVDKDALLSNDALVSKLKKANKSNLDTSNSEQTFITGEDPNNYVWYSGKLWRAVSIDPSDNSVKLITQWNISSIPYNASDNTAFEGSYMQQWLNDTTTDGFLGNLRNYQDFIKTDSVWNATQTTITTKPAKTTMVTSVVGLLNIYEQAISYRNAKKSTGYLNNGRYWWTLTPKNTSSVHYIDSFGRLFDSFADTSLSIRPAINLKSSVEVVSGSGTETDPYRLKGDKDTPAAGTKLATRYSGEYIRFGTGENNLYQIVSHEILGTTKIVSATPLKESGSYKKMAFASSEVNYSSNNTIGAFLNGEYLTSGSYLTTDQVNMIEDSTTWYLGTVGSETNYNYKLTKYANASGTALVSNTTVAKVGLLRLGELNTGILDKYENGTIYWLLTPWSSSNIYCMNTIGSVISAQVTTSYGIRPSMNLKSQVIITGGEGTKENPFTLALSS